MVGRTATIGILGPAQASPEDRLRRADVPLFPNPRTGGRWSHHALAREWERAQARAGVSRVALYAGTKHTTSTDLVRQGVDPMTLQRFLGHADRRSTDAYLVLGSSDVKDAVRSRNAPGKPQESPRANDALRTT